MDGSTPLYSPRIGVQHTMDGNLFSRSFRKIPTNHTKPGPNHMIGGIAPIRTIKETPYSTRMSQRHATRPSSSHKSGAKGVKLRTRNMRTFNPMQSSKQTRSTDQQSPAPEISQPFIAFLVLEQVIRRTHLLGAASWPTGQHPKDSGYPEIKGISEHLNGHPWEFTHPESKAPPRPAASSNRLRTLA